MGTTKIDWATKTWNIISGCTKVSEGCRNCWAKSLHDKRHKAYLNGCKMPKQYAVPFETVQLHPGRLEEPLHWRKPQRIFVASGGDLFHEDVPDGFISNVFAICRIAEEHTFMVLTKRPNRMHEMLNSPNFWRMVDIDIEAIADNGPSSNGMIKNLWFGVSVEDQKSADERIPLLLQIPAAKRFVSVEPMLERIDLTFLHVAPERKCPYCNTDYGGERGRCYCGMHKKSELDWVICGCESGTGSRPFNPDWARSLCDQCRVAGISFFLKQMPVNGKLTHMPELDGRVWDQMPEVTP